LTSCASQQQVGYVCARNRHQADRRKQQQQRGLDVAYDLAVQRNEIDPIPAFFVGYCCSSRLAIVDNSV
jgi:hypothetical protein